MTNYCTTKLPIDQIEFSYTLMSLQFALLTAQQTTARYEQEYGLGGRNYLDYHKSAELGNAKMMVGVLSREITRVLGENATGRGVAPNAALIEAAREFLLPVTKGRAARTELAAQAGAGLDEILVGMWLKSGKFAHLTQGQLGGLLFVATQIGFKVDDLLRTEPVVATPEDERIARQARGQLTEPQYRIDRSTLYSLYQAGFNHGLGEEMFDVKNDVLTAFDNVVGYRPSPSNIHLTLVPLDYVAPEE